MSGDVAGYLGPADVRRLARDIGLRPSKTRGQNFVIDANTVRRIVRVAQVTADDHVLEVGPGLGSLTLALLHVVRRVVAIEIDGRLAGALRTIVAQRAPELADRLTVVHEDALLLQSVPEPLPTALVANLPYNVAVPVLLHLVEQFASLAHGLVMVQAEVADRLVARPGSRSYGAPTVKLAWYAEVRRAGSVPRTVFWPVPNVDSGLVAWTRRPPPPSTVPRATVFTVVDAAFAQRRKSLRSALAPLVGSPRQAEHTLRRAGIDPATRGEQLSVTEFTGIAEAWVVAGE